MSRAAIPVYGNGILTLAGPRQTGPAASAVQRIEVADVRKLAVLQA